MTSTIISVKVVIGTISAHTAFLGTTDENGQVVLTLPEGIYRFRADYDGVHFWSSETDDCAVPGCLEDTVELPGGGGAEPIARTIDYILRTCSHFMLTAAQDRPTTRRID